MRERAIILIFSLLSVLAGCSWVSVDTQPHFDAPTYAPVDPGSVEILGPLPQRPYVTLGELHLDATGGASRSEIRMKLQKAAGKMGGNAVVLVGDTSMMAVGRLRAHLSLVEPIDRPGSRSAHRWRRYTIPRMRGSKGGMGPDKGNETENRIMKQPFGYPEFWPSCFWQAAARVKSNPSSTPGSPYTRR